MPRATKWSRRSSASAARLLAEEGPDALSVRRVAAEAGVSAMGVYSRFGGKQGLVEALFLDGFHRLQHVLATVPRSADPVEDLLEGSRALPPLRPRVAGGLRHHVQPGHPGVRALGTVQARRRRAPSACSSRPSAVRSTAGALRPGDPLDIAEGIWATCHGLVSLELAGMGFVADREAHFETTNAALLRGLRAD